MDHGLRARVAPEEVLTDVRAVVSLERLVVAVQGVVHHVDERVVLVSSQQLVPSAPPDDFDDVPTGALEERFQLLDNLAVSAHRSVEPLQVRVHHENQVVECLNRRHLQQAPRFGFIHFPVAQERPSALLGGVF